MAKKRIRKGSDKTLKLFDFKTKMDYLFVLGDLIMHTNFQLLEYARYIEELGELCNTSKKSGKITDYKYRDIKVKLLHSSRELLQYLVDDQNASMSYNIFRSIYKKDIRMERKLDENKDIDDLLKELLVIRHNAFHNSQSLLVATKEVFDREEERMMQDYLKRVPEILRPYTTPMKDYSLIKTPIFEYCEYEMLESLYAHNLIRLDKYNGIFKNMTNDYSRILGCELNIELDTQIKIRKLYDDSTAIVNLSMAIQQGEYTPNQKNSYDTITLKNLRNK